MKMKPIKFINVCLCILIVTVVSLPSAQAGTKEELIRLQNEIMTLQKQFLEFNESYKERFDGLRSLIEQLNDEMAKSNNTLSRIGASLNSRTEDARSQDNSLRGEIRELFEKLDDVSIGVSVLAQQFNDYKLQNAARAGSANSISADTMFNQAMGDYARGDYDMAIEGFNAYVDAYPGGESAARALLNVGDSYMQQSQLKQAVDAFTRVINNYPQSQYVPPALYKRAQIATALQERDNAIDDYRDILERFPTATEADLARVGLQLLEITQKPKTTPKATTPSSTNKPKTR